MNKNIIWAIVGLMSVAVVGIIWSQVNVIWTTIKTIEEKFDDNVKEAMYEVAQMLEREEQREYLRHTANGYSLNFLQRKSLSGQTSSGESLRKFDRSYDLSLQAADQMSSTSKIMDHILLQMSGDFICPNCGQRRHFLIDDQSDAEQSVQRPLEERLKPDRLKEALDLEFNSRGIETAYDVGVYSSIRKTWVLYNDHFLVEERISPFNPADSINEYRTFLFSSTIPSPGSLVVQFPGKRSYLWKSLRLNLLGTILFVAIIMGCFSYSVNVIFKQKKLSEMKTDFINNMTHEFKTPIATISLAADSISSPMVSENPTKIKRFANIIKQENKRMNNQVEKVLQMALLDRQEYALKLLPVNLHEIIVSAIENINLQVEQRNGVATAQLNAENPIIKGDPTHVSNIINNLLDNANKYTPENPEILVATRNVHNGLEVIIEDNGIGMSKEARKHIFDKFYRVHTGDLHDVKGFGLGLSYVKAMMDEHKGKIDVRSELGKGSSFILFFPSQVAHKLA